VTEIVECCVNVSSLNVAKHPATMVGELMWSRRGYIGIPPKSVYLKNYVVVHLLWPSTDSIWYMFTCGTL